MRNTVAKRLRKLAFRQVTNSGVDIKQYPREVLKEVWNPKLSAYQPQAVTVTHVTVSAKKGSFNQIYKQLKRLHISKTDVVTA